MAWTTFSNLTQATTVQLDNNLAILTALASITCTVTGTNSLTLTPVNAAAPIAAYQQMMEFYGIAAATNTGATTVSVVGIAGSFNVYKDTSSGPVLLTGGEIVQNCEFSLVFDQALNSNAGGFHLQTGTANAGFNAVFSSVITSSLSATALTTLAGSIVMAAATVAALRFAGGPTISRPVSTVAAISFAQIVPNTPVSATVAITGAVTLDNVLLGLPSNAPGTITFQPFVAAAGSVVISAWTSAPITVAAFTMTVRVTDLGLVP